MASGILNTGRFVITEESFALDDLVDVDADAPSNNDVVMYKDNAIEPAFTTGWHATPVTSDALAGFSTANAVQNDLLAYNDNAIDPTYDTSWVSKNVSSIFTDLESTVNSIVGINTAKIRAEAGDPAKTDMVMFSATPSGSGPTVSIGSNGPNNIISKKEPSDAAFSFVQTMDAGEVANLTYPIGTILRSSKGTYGFSGPLPTPLGPQSFALTQSQFYVSGTATLTAVSMGTEVTVTLFAANQSTILSGPTIVAAYQTSSFSCPSTGEYFVSSSGPICASVNEAGSNIRNLVPMSTELITFNTGCLVSALEATTSVTWYRRNGTTGTISVSPGTAVALGAGNTTALGNNGCVLVKADKPVSTWTTTDSIGTQALSGFPVSQLAQKFCNPSFIDSTANYAQSGVSISSPYEGTATVYDNTGTVLDTFDYSRTNPVVTAADQEYPAAGRWRPEEVSPTTTWDGGYIETTTPAICIMNFSGDTVVWNTNGEEIHILGTTPEEIKADIKKDGNGIWRRRDVSNTGVVTWNIC